MPTSPSENRLLASLPIEVHDRLAPHLELRRLELEQQLSEPEAVMSVVYFPLSGVVSLVTTTEDGDAIEAMLLGNEGVVGFWLALGTPAPPWLSIVQGDGEALVMAVDTFMSLLESEPVFHRHVLDFCGALFIATAQSVVCNRFHDLTARTARWLLLMHDRLGSDEFRLTHAFMGIMLGVHRPAVTVALRTLSMAGVVEQTARAQLRILDRAGLEDAACECYRRATGLPSGGIARY